MNEAFLNAIYKFTFEGWIDFLTFIVLALTLGFVQKYTAITEKLNKTSEKQTEELIKQRESSEKQTNEMIKQRRLTIMPSLMNKTPITPVGEGEFYVHNIGHGAAVNITIENIYPRNRNQEYYSFKRIDMLRPNEEKSVFYKYYLDGENPINFPIRELQDNREDVVKVVFNFYDIEGNKYKQTNKIGKGIYNHGFVSLLPIDPD